MGDDAKLELVLGIGIKELVQL